MDDVLGKAGKRNIVNTYVWDADGGLRTETQSFASTIEHMVGSSFEMSAALGFEGQFGLPMFRKVTTQATVNLTQTMTKTETRSKGFQLNISLDGLESRGITDHNDNPILPGEKVDRYRFMSFYLEGSSRNFQDFFNYVVDPEWLASNDEEARALREARSKPSNTWRVLHRVTYVERPALMGFGQDIRKLPKPTEESEIAQLKAEVKEMKEQNQELANQLADILQLLQDRNRESTAT